jgi:hypothetical protein
MAGERLEPVFGPDRRGRGRGRARPAAIGRDPPPGPPGVAALASVPESGGPEPATIMLGASMALGSPLYYFLAETILLNLALVLSVRHHNVVGRLLAERLERLGDD